jgi:lysophospholipase L1-like esterase
LKKLVLVGDSIFDNAIYVPPGQAVTQHLTRALPRGWEVSLEAVDGAVILDVENQLAHVKDTPTCIAVSAGGNDALEASHLLSFPVTEVASALQVLRAAQEEFHRRYELLMTWLEGFRCPVVVCTIYNAPAFETAKENTAAFAALSMFNDSVSRLARRHGFEVIELRDVFTEDGDFSAVSPIEPSERGGAKLAEELVAFCEAL